MNALRDHLWNRNRAQDSVWARVVGYPLEDAVRRLLMAIEIQAAMDESYTDEEFVIAGHIATAENWVKFIPEWQALLPLTTRDRVGDHRFKMSEMASRTEIVRQFYEVLEKYVALSIGIRINMDDWRRACRRVTIMLRSMGAPYENLGKIETRTYMVAFLIFMENFHHQRAELNQFMGGLTDPVDFIFDDGIREQKQIYEGWSDFLETVPDERRSQYGSTPQFLSDQKFLPLQAADLWAWQVRNWYEEENSETPKKMRNLDFGKWRGKGRYTIIFPLPEDHIFEYMLGYVRAKIEADRNRPIIVDDVE